MRYSLRTTGVKLHAKTRKSSGLAARRMNAITLCWAGLSFAGVRAHAWTEQGLSVLRQQLARQVLADGVHDERSPMYQALLTEAILRLAEVARCSARVQAREIRALAQGAGRAMLRSLERMVHPDGGYALLNDAAHGVAPPLAALQARFDAPADDENQDSADSQYLS